MTTSRQKAKQAQRREKLTFQPKESLATETKAAITIKNYLGGLYYFTTDEVEIKKDKIFLIEGKHSKNAKLPSVGDIKDGLLKMILYCNLENIFVGGKKYFHKPILKLTSENINGYVSSVNSPAEINAFFKNNQFNEKQKLLVNNVFEEGKENNFLVLIEKM